MKKNYLISLLAAFMAVSFQASAQEKIYEVDGGKIAGVSGRPSGITVFKAIPYAAPPVGELRWKAPQPVQPWQGIKHCDRFPPTPMQRERNYNAFQDYKMPVYECYSEDCLYLNVWAPTEKPDKPLPVMVWYYGGGFQVGSTVYPLYNGENFVKHGVIMVSINYRVGVFGFLSHPLLSKENGGTSGNYGFYDQLAGLQWVVRNIAKFGGDPNNITIFGQSAGSMSVQALMCSPLTKGLFQKAIMQSGAGIRQNVRCFPLKEHELYGKEFFEAMDITTLEQMRAMDAIELQKAYQSSKFFGKFRPSTDGKFLTHDSNKEANFLGLYPDIPYIIGYTKDDVPAANMPKTVMDWADNHLEMGRKAPYVYSFDHALPGGDMGGRAKDIFGATGAIHSVELGYMFGRLNISTREMTPADYELSNRMMEYWTNFAKYGNPNGLNSNAWQPYQAHGQNIFHINIK